MKNYIKMMRPAHWSKNVFVFAALIFGQKLIGPREEVITAVLSAFGAFLCFCLAASSMYILNDVIDRKSDLLHPEKRKRPIASGKVSAGNALLFAGVCAGAALAGSYILVKELAVIILIYLVMSVLYSVYLKQMMIIDVIIIAIGFVLRAVAGAIAVGVFISPWLIICTFALCLFLGFSKRYAEISLLAENGKEFRRTLGGYTQDLLSHMVNVTSGLAVVCFLLYSMDERTVHFFGTNSLFVTVPLVLYCVFRFSALIQKGTYTGPVQIVIKDRPFQIGFALWVLACFVIVHANRLGIRLSDLVAY